MEWYWVVAIGFGAGFGTYILGSLAVVFVVNEWAKGKK